MTISEMRLLLNVGEEVSDAEVVEMYALREAASEAPAQQRLATAKPVAGARTFQRPRPNGSGGSRWA